LKKLFTVHKTWRFIRKCPVLSVISRGLFETNKFTFKTDRYEYKNLPYLEIHHHWPTHYLQYDTTHQTAAQAYQNLAERFTSGTEQIHIYTDASKRSDICSVAIHSPHLPICETQRNIHSNSSVLSAELTAIYLALKQFQKLIPLLEDY